MKNDSLELLALKKKADQGFFSGFSSVLFFRQFGPFALKPKLFLYRDVRLISFFTHVFLGKKNWQMMRMRRTRGKAETDPRQRLLFLRCVWNWKLVLFWLLYLCSGRNRKLVLICTDIFNLVPVNYLLLNTILLISWVTR